MGKVVESRTVLHVCCWFASAKVIPRAEVSWGPFGIVLQDVRVAAVPRFGLWSIVGDY